MVACRENGKETAMRLIKHFSSECEDDWEKESGLVNVLGETEHPNILTYCWHCKGMYLAAFFSLLFSPSLSLFFLGFFFRFCIELCFFGGHSVGETRKKSDYPNKGPTFRLCSTRNWAAGGSCLSEAV